MMFNQLYNTDCLEGMKLLLDNSVDAIVTDPPYGLSFMGKKWDYQVPSVDIWKEALRVLKPGGHLLSFGGTRTYHRMVVNIEDAGFEIRDCIQWIYGSGFPKSLDISKAIDKRNGRYFDQGFKDYCNECRKQLGYSLARVNELMGTALTGGGFASCTMGNKDSNELPTLEMYRKLKIILQMDDRYGSLIETVECDREVIGVRNNGSATGSIVTTRTGKLKRSVEITSPNTTIAKQYDGWGTALKPANEPICVARKPINGTVANNIVQFGTGGLNIDACRIEFLNEGDRDSATWGRGTIISGGNYVGGKTPYETDIEANPKGRFPSNVILDEEAAFVLDQQTGTLISGNPCGIKKASNKIYGQYAPGGDITGYGDSGGASRFFYVAKTSQQERGAENNHPTVKPIELMQYLIKMITPPEGIVLDPFSGSGTTLIAASMLGFKYIGYEVDPQYFKIANNRLSSNLGLFK